MDETKALHLAREALRQGNKATARGLLSQVLKAAPRNEIAWLLLSASVDDSEKERYCLNQVLAINPSNQVAKLNLERLSQPGTHIMAPPRPISQSQVPLSEPKPSVATTSAFSPNGQPATNLSQPNRYTQVMGHTFAIEPAQILGVIGCASLLVGVFAPIVRLPLVGSMNYIQNGRGDGVFVLLLGLVSLILVILKRYKWLWLTGLGSLGMLCFTLIRLIRVISSVRSLFGGELSNTLFGGLLDAMLESIQIEWGWAILLLGTLLTIAAAAAQWRSEFSWWTIGGGLLVAFVLLLLALLLPDYASSAQASSSSVPPRAPGGEKNPIPVDHIIDYTDGSLRVLQIHDPTGFLVVNCSAFIHQEPKPISGTHFVSVEFEFTCSPTQVVCESVPEASLKLLLEDGRQIEDDWCLYDAARLGEEDVAGGKKISGWRVFRVPDNATIDRLLVEPYQGAWLYARVPDAVDGYNANYPWIEGEPGTSIQIIPRLRQDLVASNLEVGAVVHAKMVNAGQFLIVDICEEPQVYFDQEKALADHAQAVLGVALSSRKYMLEGENLGIRFTDCSSISPTTLLIAFQSRDLELWGKGLYRDNEFLQHALVSLD